MKNYFNCIYNNKLISNARNKFLNSITPIMRHCSSSLSSIVYLPLSFKYDLLCFKDFDIDNTFRRLSLYDSISLFVIGAISASKRLKLDISSSGVNLFCYPVLLICLFDVDFRIAFRNYVSSLRINNAFPLGIVLVMDLFQSYRFGDKCSHFISRISGGMNFNVLAVRGYLLNLLFSCGCITIIKDGSKITSFTRDELLAALISNDYVLDTRRARPTGIISNFAITRLLSVIQSDNRFSALLIHQLVTMIVLISGCLKEDTTHLCYDRLMAVLLHDLSRFCSAFQLKLTPIDFADFRSSDLGIYAYSFSTIPNLVNGLNFSITAGSSATPSGVMFYLACIVQPCLVGASAGSASCTVGLSNSVVISSILTPMELIIDTFISCLFADNNIVSSSSINASRAGSHDAKVNTKMAPVANQLVSPDVASEQVTTAKTPAVSTVTGPIKSGKTVSAVKSAKTIKSTKTNKALKEANN